MTTTLHSIELEQNGDVFATFRNEQEYDEHLGDLAVDYYDEDEDFGIPGNYTVWYCVMIDGEITSLTEEQYRNSL